MGRVLLRRITPRKEVPRACPDSVYLSKNVGVGMTASTCHWQIRGIMNWFDVAAAVFGAIGAVAGILIN